LSDVVLALGPTLPEAAARRLLQPCGAAASFPFDFRLIGTPAIALKAAAAAAIEEGLVPVVLGDDIEGESWQVGVSMAELARRPVTRPTVLLSGGETTVTLTGSRVGRGGRNTEFLLSLIADLKGHAGIWGLAADTDGEDGASGGAAGALAGPDTLARASAAGLDPAAHLADHDSGSFFAGLGDLLRTGPTRTNVNDFRAILILPQGSAQ
jgi:hydroxypyruvate reductase